MINKMMKIKTENVLCRIPVFIETILSFVVMSGVALIYLRKSIKFLVK